MTETSRLISSRQLTTSSYQPMRNGLIERCNGMLKQKDRQIGSFILIMRPLREVKGSRIFGLCIDAQ